MKKYIFNIALVLAAILTTGCSEIEPVPSSNIFTLNIQMPSEANTRVGLSEIDNSKDLKASWKEDDEVSVFIRQDKELCDLGKVKVSNITTDGKIARITLEIPGRISQKEPFIIYCFTGINGSIQDFGNGLWVPCCTMEITRSLKSQLKAPMFGMVETNALSSVSIPFKHIGTYEVLHLKNDGMQDISFVHCGFETPLPWYQGVTGVNIYDGYDYKDLSSEWDGDSESPELTIPAGKEGVFLSSYMPSGFKMNNATLVSRVNGVVVRSLNTKSSSVSILPGHAYHMYATWNEEGLRFDEKITNPAVIKVEPTQIDFGTIDAGTSKTEYFTVKNKGESKLTFTVSEPHGCFEIPESGKEFTLAAGEKKKFSVTFSSSVEDANESASVSIVSNAENGTQYLSLVGKTTSPRIEQVVPDEIRDKMGPYITIYEGNNPPSIEGVFVMDPPEVVYDTTNSYSAGEQGFIPVYMKFSNQNTTQNTLDYEERGVDSDGKITSESSGPGAFISGDGNNFSVFFSTKGVNHRDGYDVKTRTSLVISGTKTDSGIKDVRYAFVMVEKENDINHDIMNVGEFRVFKDGDGLAKNSSWPSGARSWGKGYIVKDGKITTPWSIYSIKK